MSPSNQRGMGDKIEKKKKKTELPRYNVVFNLALSLAALSAENPRGSHFDTDCPPPRREEHHFAFQSRDHFFLFAASRLARYFSVSSFLLLRSYSSEYFFRPFGWEPMYRSTVSFISERAALRLLKRPSPVDVFSFVGWAVVLIVRGAW